MSLSLSFIVLSFFAFICVANGSEIKIIVNRYSGLRQNEMKIFRKFQSYYHFQFCLCPKNVSKINSQNILSKCVCSNAQRGKKVIESIPYAAFKSKNCVPGNLECLQTTLKSNRSISDSKLFVKVDISRKSFIEFQEIPIYPRNFGVLLSSGSSSKMRIVYSTEVPENSFAETEKIVEVWKKGVRYTPKGGASAFFNSVDEQKQIMFKKSHNLDFNSTSTNLDKEILQLNNMNSIKRFIFAKGRKDRVDPSSYNTAELQKWITIFHNMYRARHNAASLSTDITLEKRGKRWADELAYSKMCLVHEKPRVYGENLFFFGASKFPNPKSLANAVVQSFYLEGVGYNYNNWRPASYYRTGHFTQLVWKKTTRLGVGVTISKTQKRSPCYQLSPNMYLIFICVKYDPAGNFDTRHEYLSNVQPPVV